MPQSQGQKLITTHAAAVIFKALLFFIPLSCIVVLLIWRIYAVERQSQLQKIIHDEQARLELVAQNLESKLQQSVEDLLFLEALDAPTALLQAPSPSLKTEIEHIFIALAERTGDYDQLRLLNAAGKEVVRVNHNQGAPAAVAQNQLQDKSQRYYFKDVISLPKGQIFISPLDLNIEQGQVERPFKPMLRLAMPLYDDQGEPLGVLLLNMLAKDLLRGLGTFGDDSDQLMLMNRNGYWLKGLAPDEEFGFMFPDHPAKLEMRFQQRHPQVWKNALNQETTQQLTKDGLFCTQLIRPLKVGQWSSSGAPVPHGDSKTGLAPSQYVWVLCSHLSRSNLAALLPSPLRFQLLAGALVLLFAAGSYVLSLLHHHLRSAYSQLKTSYTSLGNAEARLRDREAFYRALFENNLAMLMLVSPEDGAINQANASAAAFYGHDHAMFARMSLPELDERRDPEVLAELNDAAGKESVRRFATHVLSTGERREMELYIGPVQHDQRTLLFIILHDVTEQRRAQRDLQERERLLSTISNAAQDAIIMIDAEDHPLFWNPAAEKMFGYSFEDIKDTSLHALLTPPEDRQRALQAIQHFAKTGEGPIVDTLAEMTALKKDGRKLPVEISLSALRLPNGWSAVASVRDITERKEFEHKLQVLATTDPLTGLANRRAFMDAAERELKRAKRHQQGLALLMLDLDHFKNVNDTHGHDAGDKVLQNLATVCKRNLRTEDICGRIGGEEFAILLTETDRQGALQAAERIRADIETSPVDYTGHNIAITASIGLAMAFDNNADTIPALLNMADTALYRAKDNGRNRVEQA